MSTAIESSGPAALTDTGAGRRNLLRILVLETRYEFLKLLRMPGFVLPVFLFPLIFYALFGLAFGASVQPAGSTGMARYLIVSYGVFGVIGANLFSLGVGLAAERGQGWMLLKRATPMPPLIHFTARILVGMAFSALIVMALFTLAATAGGVTLPTATWASLFGVLVVGGIPFAALGLALGYHCGPNAAPAVINLLYLPLAFASGLWIPFRMLPELFQKVGPYLPPYQLAQQAYRLIDAADTPTPTAGYAALYLGGFTLLCLVEGLLAYHRDQRTYG